MKALVSHRAIIGLMSALLLTINVFAQQPRIREPAFGVEFKAPEGWQYQRNETGYIMEHNTMPGLIMVMSTPYKTIAEMRQGAYWAFLTKHSELRLVESQRDEIIIIANKK